MGHLDNSCVIIIFQVMYQVLRAPFDSRVLLAPEGTTLSFITNYYIDTDEIPGFLQ